MNINRYTNSVDSQYLDCLRKIKDEGVYKETRSGAVYSCFGMSMRFSLQYGFPVLTTKKMFTRGFIHELLWFLKGDTNIKYLIDNNVNFWTPDAYRFYNELLTRDMKIRGEENVSQLLNIGMDEFIERVKDEQTITLARKKNEHGNIVKLIYRYGDLGDVYGKQWRHWGNTDYDQIKNIIYALRKNPYDRRLLLTGYNPEVVKDIALPPCHTLYQFNARPLTYTERLTWCDEHLPEASEWKNPTHETMTSKGCPIHALSLWFYCRSQDMPLGNPANIMSASLLLSMIAQCVDMVPDEVIWNGGDCHIYENQMEGVEEQLQRDPHRFALPRLVLNPEIHHINDFRFEDIKIENYKSYPTIKFPLSVG